MPALNFQKRFTDLIIKDKKRQTIRLHRKDNRNPTKGTTLYLYVGMRTKSCRKLKEVICKEVESVVISTLYLTIGSNNLNWSEADEFAKKDGFENYSEFYDFFSKTHGLPFYGLLIKW